MNIFYIIGSGGFAKEVLFLAKRSLLNSEYNFGGFIDFQPVSDSIIIGGHEYPVINEDFFLANVSSSQKILLYCGIGDPTIIFKLREKYRGYQFPNLIHPNVEYHPSSLEIGEGNIITAGCLLTVDIRIGNFNVFNLNTTVGHDTQIGDCNVFNPGANISGAVIIRDENLIGTNASILQGVKIGSRNKLGAACMVNKSIENELTMVGIPARALNSK